MYKVKRTRTGTLAYLIAQINASYEYLDVEQAKYEEYLGGQPPFQETECYIREREILDTLERDLSYSLRTMTQTVKRR